jgi:methionyl-tRNA formyltransferase
MVETAPLRIAFFGTPEFAVPTLHALLNSRHTVAGVVSQPDRPRGRGARVAPTPVKATARAADLPVLQPERLKDPGFREAFDSWAADLAVVAAYGKILPEWLIAIPRLGMINVHASLLPRYRGAAPIQRAVMAGETETGVTIMRIVKELDAGPMFARVIRPIPPDATSADVERDLARAGGDLLVGVVNALAAGRAEETPQDHTRATYAPKITKDEGAIDWARPARDVHNQVRGLIPWPMAWTRANGVRLLIVRTDVDADRPNGVPGEVVEAAGDVLRVAAGDGVLRLLSLKPEGKRAMSAREFLAGHAVAVGTRLT